MIVAGMMISPEVNLVSLFKLMQKLKLYNTYLGLIISYSVFQFPFTVLLFRSDVYKRQTYISRLLKKYAGKSFLEYLTDVRFKHVEKLIADDRYKQYEICLLYTS